METNIYSDSPLSPWERVGVRVPLAMKSQWKRLRRFPRYGAFTEANGDEHLLG